MDMLSNEIREVLGRVSTATFSRSYSSAASIMFSRRVYPLCTSPEG